MSGPEVPVCGVCGDPGTLRLIDMMAEARITGQRSGPGEQYRAEGRCEDCWAKYRRLLDQLDAEYSARHPRPARTFR